MGNARDQLKGIQTTLQQGGYYQGELDGLPGRQSDAAWAALCSAARKEAQVPQVSTVPGTNTLPNEAIALILDAEGIDQPYRWPGGDSGITLGYGCDIGADPKSLEYWRGVLTDDQINRLSIAKGVTGGRANALESRFGDIKITKAMAEQVFFGFTLPIECALTKAKFPGSDQLPAAAFGALVSLVFNRGASLGIDDGDPSTHDSREEMRAIFTVLKDGVQNGDLQKIADNLRSMKRLWAGKGLDGLITRREAEARLVESAI